MSLGGFVGGTFRALVLAAVTGAAAFGLLVVFQPFDKNASAPPAVSVSGTPAANSLQVRIEALRVSLRDADAALEAARAGARDADSALSPGAASRAQYEVQIAAATERRDLARRHAEAIRTSLDAGVTPSSLAQIRDSVVIGQLLTRQVTLDAQIAVEGARLRPGHPTMRALNAQRAALLTQIRQEAASIASALEAESRIDDAQIKLLEAQLPAMPVASSAPADMSALAMRAVAQRAELDSLVDTYFNIPPAPVATASQASAPFNLMNVAVVVVAALAALMVQLLLAVRGHRAKRPTAADVAAWDADHDPEIISGVEEPEPLRKAS